MRRAVLLVLGGVLLLGACGDGESGAADTSGGSTTLSEGSPSLSGRAWSAPRRLGLSRSALAKSWRGPPSGARRSASASWLGRQ